MLFRRSDLQVLCYIRDDWYWLCATVFIVFCMYFLYMCYKSFVKARSVEDTPTAKIRSAPQGYVELIGHQQPCPIEPVQTKLSHLPCTCYWYQIEVYMDKRWQIIEQGKSPSLFIINDGTGTCYIDPTGADISTPICESWRGHRRYPAGIPQGFWAKFISSAGRFRYTEWRMESDMPIYVAGNFLTLRQSNIEADTKTKRVKTLVYAWKKHHLPVLNAFFSTEPITSESTTDQKEFLSPTINVISGYDLDKRHPFIISGHGERKIARRYKLDAFIWGVSFMVLFTFTAFIVHIKLTC